MTQVALSCSSVEARGGVDVEEAEQAQLHVVGWGTTGGVPRLAGMSRMEANAAKIMRPVGRAGRFSG